MTHARRDTRRPQSQLADPPFGERERRVSQTAFEIETDELILDLDYYLGSRWSLSSTTTWAATVIGITSPACRGWRCRWSAGPPPWTISPGNIGTTRGAARRTTNGKKADPMHHLHHAHLFAADLDETLAFYREVFDAEIVLDAELAGARNVFARIGSGRLHFYDQPPPDDPGGAVHHLGIQTDDFDGVLRSVEDRGVELEKGIREQGAWRYLMVPAPDGVLLEVFEVDRDALPADLRDYFA